MNVLLACASLTAEQRASLPALASDCDWNALISAAGVHGLLPLLYWRLRESPPAVSPDRWQFLRQNFERSARLNLALASQMRAVLDALQSSGVPALAFKGPVLAAAVHGNLALRNSSDLDLLISHRDLDKACDALAACGFRTLHPYTARQLRALRRDDFALDFTDGEGRLVDLHWRFVPRYFGMRCEFDAFWERRRAIDLGGAQFPTLSHEDTIFATALHGSKHSWSRLAWLWDLAAAIDCSPNLDWPALLQRARAARASGLLLVGLVLARDLLGADLPAAVTAEIQSRPAVAQVARAMAAGLQSESAALARSRWSLTLRMMDSRSQRLAATFGFLTTSGPAEWSLLRLPDSLFWLYPAVRLARLAGLARPSKGA